jgi:heat shock protein 4
LGDPIEERFKEEKARGPYIEQLLNCINSFREAARSKDSKFDHIEVAEKEKACLSLAVMEYFSLNLIILVAS